MRAALQRIRHASHRKLKPHQSSAQSSKQSVATTEPGVESGGNDPTAASGIAQSIPNASNRDGENVALAKNAVKKALTAAQTAATVCPIASGVIATVLQIVTDLEVSMKS